MSNEALTRQIATLKDTNILVSASAGAGKTTLLIKRLMTRILEDRLSVNQICALTFSEAAAHEMKDRLKAQLAIAHRDCKEEDMASFIKEQLSLIDTAMISTIHSFALSLIKDFSYVLNLDPEMSRNVLDDGTRQLLFDECSDAVIQKAMVQSSEAFQACQSLVSTSAFDFSELKKIIQDIYQIRRLQLNPEQFDQKTLLLHQDPLSVIQPILSELINNQLIEANDLCEEVLRLASSTDTDMKSVIELQTTLVKMKKDVYEEKLLDVLKTMHSPFWIRGIPKITEYPSYSEAKTKLQNLIKALVNSFNDMDEHVHDVLGLVPHIEFVVECVKDLTLFMQAKKDALKVIEFDDMERLAYNILTHPDFDVPAFYQSRFSDILVDEFQDTNDVQNEIITLISNGSNVFRVGDVKQSIYRFRGAKPQLMRTMIKESTSEIFTLPHNFRSSEPIVEFNNLLFSMLMNVEGFSDVYLKDDHVTVGRDTQKNITIPVTYIKVNKSQQVEEEEIIESENEEIEDDEDNQDHGEEFKTKSYDKAADHVKARVITKDIIHRHQDCGIPFKDICVLVKSHAQKDILKKLFDEKGIPHFINSPQGFLKHPAITQLLMLANYCLFPNDYYLSGVLLSQFTPLTSDEVAQLKLQGDLHLALLNQYPELYESLTQLLDTIQASSLSQSIHECCKFHDFYQRCDSQGKLNTDALIQKAIDFENSHQGGLAAFIQSLEHLKDAKIAEAMDVALSDDVVKVMTIHASKGLQFPLVYVFNDESTTIHASRDQVIVDPNYGFTLRIKQAYGIEVKNIVREALLYIEKKAAYEETLRLWYVALTRAEKEMVCVGMNKEVPSTSSSLHASTILKSKGINGLLSSLQVFIPNRLLEVVVTDDPDRSGIISIEAQPQIDVFALPLTKKENPKPLTLIPLDKSNRLKPNEVGSLVHKILSVAVISNQPIQAIESMSLDLSKTQIEGMMSFFNHPLTSSWNEYQKFSEYPIITQDELGFHQYYLDLLMKKDDEWIIVDFKTDRVSTLEELKTRYTDQLSSYQKALKDYAPSLKTIIYSIVLKDAIEII
jgi:ATP-dependent helicase/nuclease subunit A